MIIETKLHVPRTNGYLINRSHLFKRLERGLNRKLTIITAAAGYGKSTLLSEWVKTVNITFAWVSLDENDNDPVRFWRHTIESLHQTSPAIAEQLDLKSEGVTVGNASIAKLINRLNRLSENIVLIWDDFHCVNNEQILNHITYFLEHLPPSVHICIASRTYPALSLSRMRVEGNLNELSADDLRFGEEEAIEFFNKCTDLSFNQSELMVIQNKTEGWVAGMRLMALSMDGTEGETPQTFIEKITGEYYTISDYFFEEVFIKQSAEIQKLLLKTSLLERIHIELVDLFLNIQTGAKWMHELESENLFLISLDDKRMWYRYHHLFQEFLQRKLFELLPDEWRGLNCLAGKWFEENGLLDEAIHYYLAGEKYSAAIQLLEKEAPALIHTDINMLRAWFDKIPDALLLENANLAVHDIFSLLMMGEAEKADEKLNQCLEAVTDSSSRSSLEMLRAMSALFAQEFELFVHLSEDFVKKYPEADDFMSLGTEGDLEIPKWSLLDVVGNLKEREHLIRQLLASWTNSKYYYFKASLYLGYGELMYEWNRLEEAERYFQEAKQLGEAHQNKLLIISANIFLVRVNIAAGRIEKAEEIIHSLETEMNYEQFPKLHEFVQVYQTYFLLLLGRPDQALQWLNVCGLSVTDEIPDTMLIEYNLFAILLAEKGNKDDAISLILRLKREAGRYERQGDYIRLLIQYSIFLADKGDTARSLDALEEALALAEENHYERTLIDEGKAFMSLLQLYLVTRKKQHRKSVHQVSLTYVKRLLSFNKVSIRTKTDRMAETDENIYLTEKEMLVLQLLTTSLTNKEIADELHVSLSTAKTHINSIYGKLGVNNRMEAIERGKLLNFI